jgi:hypothetical protein
VEGIYQELKDQDMKELNHGRKGTLSFNDVQNQVQ